MEEKQSIRSAMVSRLPKFGGRSPAGSTTPLSNGSAQQTAPIQDVRSTPPRTRRNGMIHSSPFSVKWKRDEGRTPSSATSPVSPGDEIADEAQPQISSFGNEVKKGSPATPKMRRSGALMVAISSPKPIPRQSLKLSPKVGTQLGHSPLNRGPKMGHNSPSIPAQNVSESSLMRQRLSSSSPRSSSQDSLSQSSESLKTSALDNIVRSNSFTHIKQIPSPTSQPMTRSFSFNRAVELAKPLTNTQLRPPRSNFLKPLQLSNGRLGLGLGGLSDSFGGSGGLGGGLGGPQCSRMSSGASSLPTLSIPSAPMTPSTLRKPLLPNSVLTKSLSSSGGSFGYRLTRSGEAKQQNAPFPCRVNRDVRPVAAPVRGELLAIATDIELTSVTDKGDSHSESDGSSAEEGRKGGGSGKLTQSSGQAAGETLEDMSLSSASSIERGDTSEELTDDLSTAGDVLSDGDLSDNRTTGNTTETPRQGFHNETLVWDNMATEDHKEESPMEDSHGPLGLSPECSEVLQASSVELSPSNSSGGTYMWDEEGLEPLKEPGAHPCDNCDDSELNSMDILNNLYPLGTGELDDDDLMLDVDLPEDGLHGSNKMSHMERSDRINRQGPRHKHHRWSGPDRFHNDNRTGIIQHIDGFKASRISPLQAPSTGRQNGYTAILDGLTLDHMTQDCSSMKNQLLRLRTLLQLEDTESPTDVPEEIEDPSSASQMEELIKEVQVLREELRSRDRTISQLTLQCKRIQQHQWELMPTHDRQYKCQSHLQRAPSSLRQSDRRIQHHYDKATQTYWRPPFPTPQILQPFNPGLSKHFHKGSPVKSSSTEGRSDSTRSLLEEETQIDTDCLLEELMLDVSSPADPNDASHLLSQLQHQSSGTPRRANGGRSPASAALLAAQPEWRAPAEVFQDSITPGSAASAGPCMLQPPRPHEFVSLPALKAGGAGGFASPKPGCSSGPLANRTKQLPPPSRGLPCFNAGPQVQPQNPCLTSLLQPRRASEHCRGPRPANSSPEENNQGTLKEPGSTKTPIPLSRSSLPKPKIP
ncbi:serine-rich coiled-coil domain-containing protein 2 [Brachionichthys hirsutus]|uniref:serine-rich coiled-coil domain-containing protein 2 n=1 Tax=Brachionichthys hirsutus TaxID=412623 RepID=UPI00360456F0